MWDKDFLCGISIFEIEAYLFLLIHVVACPILLSGSWSCSCGGISGGVLKGALSQSRKSR